MTNNTQSSIYPIELSELEAGAPSFINYIKRAKNNISAWWVNGVDVVATKYDKSITSIVYCPETQEVLLAYQMRPATGMTLLKNNQTHIDLDTSCDGEAFAGFVDNFKNETVLEALFREVGEEVGNENLNPTVAFALVAKSIYSSPDNTVDNLMHCVVTVTKEEMKKIKQDVIVGAKEENEAIIVKSVHVNDLENMIAHGKITNAISMTNALLFLNKKDEIDAAHFTRVNNPDAQKYFNFPSEIKEEIPEYRRVESEKVEPKDRKSPLYDIFLPREKDKIFKFQIAKTPEMVKTAVYVPETDEFVFFPKTSPAIMLKTGDLKEAYTPESAGGYVNQDETVLDATNRLLKDAFGKQVVYATENKLLGTKVYPCPGSMDTLITYNIVTVPSKQVTQDAIRISRKEIIPEITKGTIRDGNTVSGLLLALKNIKDTQKGHFAVVQKYKELGLEM